jgi:S1-C subfamily serine protease
MTTSNPHGEPDPEPQYPTEGTVPPDAQQYHVQYPQYPGFGPHPGYGGGSYPAYGPHAAGDRYPSGDPYAHADPYATAGYPYPPAAAPAKRGRNWRLGAGIAAITAAALVGGIAIGDATSHSVSGSGSQALLPTTPGSGGSDSGGGLFPNGGNSGGSSSGGTSGGTSTSVTLANGKQKTGVVTIVSTLRYQNAQSAGTGMILSSDGEVLTNNHVVNGATSIVVTVASTGRSYRADVVGTAPTKDVAVLQLRNASNLKTANLGQSDNVKVGDAVVGVGNAGGTGTLRASSGKVTALNQTITASDDGSGTDSERLTGLIEVNAPIISGDSGGPLYGKSGDVIGMDTAASANPAVTRAYAIPIKSALNIADQIESGKESSTIHIGLPPFLGVGVAQDTGSVDGAAVSSLLDGGPAAAAGITDGSVITKVGGTRVHSGTALKSTLAAYQPGDKVTVTWTDPAGTSHTATVTLATGPAD